jgi:hypothetical protein
MPSNPSFRYLTISVRIAPFWEDQIASGLAFDSANHKPGKGPLKMGLHQRSLWALWPLNETNDPSIFATACDIIGGFDGICGTNAASGTILQNTNLGGGYFLGKTNAGSIRLEPQLPQSRKAEGQGGAISPRQNNNIPADHLIPNFLAKHRTAGGDRFAQNRIASREVLTKVAVCELFPKSTRCSGWGGSGSGLERRWCSCRRWGPCIAAMPVSWSARGNWPDGKGAWW